MATRQRRYAAISPNQFTDTTQTANTSNGRNNIDTTTTTTEWTRTQLITLAISVPCYAVLLHLIAQQVNQYVPSPYMDEPFHTQQTAHYCAGNFTEWDPKITTLPGLYVLPTITHMITGRRLLRHTVKDENVCDLFTLRSYNLLYACGCAVLLYLIIEVLHPSLSTQQQLVHTTRLAFFPLHFFFIFLYYTDTLSTCCVLLVFYLSLLRSYSRQPTSPSFLSQMALLSAALSALLCRQTNIIWIMFSAGWIIIQQYHTQQQAQAQTTGVDHPYTSNEWRSLPTSVYYLGVYCVNYLVPLFLLCVPHLLTAYVFMIFLIWNHGRIVLGDATHHAASAHMAQVLYLSAFITAFTIISHAHTFLSIGKIYYNTLLHTASNQSQQAWLRLARVFVFSVIVLSLIIAVGTYSHPFLLADNRHVTFYLWRYLFARSSYIRYALIPIYLFCFYFLHTILSVRYSILQQTWLLLCVCLTLIPSPLIELRYYIVPFIITELLMIEGDETDSVQNTRTDVPAKQSRSMYTWILLAEWLLYVSMNVVMLYVLLYRPYTWGDGSTARFMW